MSHTYVHSQGHTNVSCIHLVDPFILATVVVQCSSFCVSGLEHS